MYIVALRVWRSWSWSIAGNGTINGADEWTECNSGCRELQESYTLTLTIVDGNGCTSTCDVDGDVVNAKANMLRLAGTNSPVCEGDTDGPYV